MRAKLILSVAVLFAIGITQDSLAQQQDQGPPPYQYKLAIPAICMGVGEMEPGAFSATCDAIEAVNFGAELSDATKMPEAGKEVLRVLLKAGGEKVVFLSFPKEMGLDDRVALVEAMMEATASVFNYIAERMEADLKDQLKANLLHTKWALDDSKSIQLLRQEAFAQHAEFVQAAKAYLTTNPGAPGIRFYCVLACNQLIAAAEGVDVFDTPIPSANSQGVTVAGQTGQTTTSNGGSTSGSHGHKALIIGGSVVAGAALIGGVAGLAARAVNCSQQETACTNAANQCLNQHINCGQVGSTCDASCRCRGFSGFNVGTGSCQ